MSISSNSYSIIEPHPSVPSTHYLTTGRGGAGNAIRAPSSVTHGADATGPASRVALTLVPSASSTASRSSWSGLSTSSSLRKTYTAGRGGAGNVYPASERAIFSFDEELERQLSLERHAAPVFHVGRGGAGNVAPSSSSQYSTTSTTVNRPQYNCCNSKASSIFGAQNHQQVYDAGYGRRRPSEDSEASSRSSESGADAFNRGIKKGWKKMIGGYM